MENSTFRKILIWASVVAAGYCLYMWDTYRMIWARWREPNYPQIGIRPPMFSLNLERRTAV